MPESLPALESVCVNVRCVREIALFQTDIQNGKLSSIYFAQRVLTIIPVRYIFVIFPYPSLSFDKLIFAAEIFSDDS